MSSLRYTTPHGITVTRTTSKVSFARGLDSLLKKLDTSRGIYLSSGYEYPERYARWDVVSMAPPVELVGRDRSIEIRALNGRGAILNQLSRRFLEHDPAWESFQGDETVMSGEL